MKFFAIVFLTIAFCLSVNAKRVLNKRYYLSPNECSRDAVEIDHRLNKYFEKLEDLTHDKKEHDFDHTHHDAINHLTNQANEIHAYINRFQISCQPHFNHVPGIAQLLQEVRGHCNEIKTYYLLMNQRITNLNYYNAGINGATTIVTSKCSYL